MLKDIFMFKVCGKTTIYLAKKIGNRIFVTNYTGFGNGGAYHEISLVSSYINEGFWVVVENNINIKKYYKEVQYVKK